ncbi:H+/Cl- antiporter ClcA [Streptomyces umbrinus]|uniref:H+/Cl- antiporter ClcA n=1 Tax=Streptomyces umbrinus TaxID=67370 RepID=A0ABU0T109_9ACTN|nr:chloride channel protein [Streptomyces umbrinus]MDQ1029509.1 H+/Cl- antiporter ClcA [Streptomyces umbrinus]
MEIRAVWRGPVGNLALPLAEWSPSGLRRSVIAEQKRGEAAEAAPGNQPQEADQLRDILRRPEYLRALVFCAVIGILVSFAAFWFLVLLHEMESLIWVDWPHDLGWTTPPWWWPLPLALVSGAVVALVVLRFPGRGGHIPAGGLHAGGASKAAVPGVALAALASLPLGAVLGPEAPLIALGGGLALVFRDLVRAPATESSTALLGAAGAAAAISTIFGNPLVAAVLLMEVAGVGGPQLFVVMLPALLAGGVGAIVFTGFGHWTGLDAESLSIGLPAPPTLDLGDVVWSTLMAVVLGAAVHWIIMGGRVAARFVSGHVVRNTMLCALAAGGCATLYAVVTGRSPAEVALSGQATLTDLAAHPHAWSVGSLVAVLVFKGIAYSLCLGSLRGGPVFPSLFLGGAMGVLLSPLPGLGVVPGMAAGMAAASAAALRLPVSCVVLVVLMVGNSETVPVIVIAAVVAFVTTELLPQGPGIPPFSARPGRAPRPGS